MSINALMLRTLFRMSWTINSFKKREKDVTMHLLGNVLLGCLSHTGFYIYAIALGFHGWVEAVVIVETSRLFIDKIYFKELAP